MLLQLPIEDFGQPNKQNARNSKRFYSGCQAMPNEGLTAIWVVGRAVCTIGYAITVPVPGATAVFPAAIVFTPFRCAVGIPGTGTYPDAAHPHMTVATPLIVSG